MNRWMSRVAIVLAVVALALVPTTVDVRSMDVDLVVGVCQNEDCMPAYGWVCGGRDDKCNLIYKACRDLAETEEESAEVQGE